MMESHRELSAALEKEDVSQALVAVEALRSQLIILSSNAESSEKEEDGRVEHVASYLQDDTIIEGVDPNESSMIVSDVPSIQKLFRLHAETGAVTLHRLENAVLLADNFGGESSSRGLVDPETGEMIVLLPSSNTRQVRAIKPAVVREEDRFEPVPADDSYRRVVKCKLDEVDVVLGSTLVFSEDGHRRVAEASALDSWLDEAILDSNAVCYHKDGRVQGYLSTQEFACDNVEENVVTLKNAAGILRFVQKHCVEDNATYCLTRRKDRIQLWKVVDKRCASLDRAVAALCLRIARHLDDDDDDNRCDDRLRRERLLRRCLALAADDDSPLKAEARLLLATQCIPDPEASSSKCCIMTPPTKGPWLVWPPAEVGDLPSLTDNSGLAGRDRELTYLDCLEHATLGLHALDVFDERLVGRKKRKKKSNNEMQAALLEASDKARLGLASVYYARERPGAAMRELALSTNPSRLRIALVYAQMASVVTTANLAEHRADLLAKGKVASRIDRELPVEVCADVDANLARAIKALVGALPAGRDLLRVAYTRLGERYVRVERLTKAARHFSEGIELFRGVGDSSTEAWLKVRLASIQLRVADRANNDNLRSAVQALAAAHKDFDEPPTSISAKGRLVGAEECVCVTRKILAEAYMRLGAEDRALEYADDAQVKVDAHYKRGLRLVRSGEPRIAADHLRAALREAGVSSLDGESASLKKILDALSMRLDLVSVLLMLDLNREALVVLRNAPLDQMVAALTTMDRETTTPQLVHLVLSSFHQRLNDVLRRCLAASSSSSSQPSTKAAELRAAYAAAIRLQKPDDALPSSPFSSSSFSNNNSWQVFATKLARISQQAFALP